MQHTLSNKDRETLLGDCVVCGPNVPLYLAKKQNYLICAERRKERKRHNAKNVYSPAKNRWQGLKTRYSISETEYNEMWLAQGECCAVCKVTEPTAKGWQIDHDHNCCSCDLWRMC